MRLEVRDSMDTVVGAFDFEIDPYQERKIQIQSNLGGAMAPFQDSTPMIYVRVPTYSMTTAEVEPASEEEPPPVEEEPPAELEQESGSLFPS